MPHLHDDNEFVQLNSRKVSLSNCSGKTCWKSVQKTAHQLSEDSRFSDIVMLDAFIANNLIMDMQHSKKINDIKEKWTNLNAYWLLTEALPSSGYLGFTKFCCLLHAKNRISQIERNLCNECAISFSKCQTSDSIKFYVDSSCKPILKSALPQSSIYTDHVDVAGVPVLVKDMNEQEMKWDPVVFTESLVCINNKITATLTIDNEEIRFREDVFYRDIVDHLNIAASEVKIALTNKNNTWMLLRLSTRAGLKLLSTFRLEKLKSKFEQAVATKAWSSKSTTNFTIQVTISDLRPYTMYVEKGDAARFDEGETLLHVYKSLLHVCCNCPTLLCTMLIQRIVTRVFLGLSHSLK